MRAPWELQASAAELKRAFDRGFAEAYRPPADSQEDLLAIALGADPLALRLSEIAGLQTGRMVTPLPGSVPALLGLAAVSGALLPVYDLGTLLGYPTTTTPRWFVVVAALPVVLSLDRFDGHLRVPRHTITEATMANADIPGRRAVREVVHADGQDRPIVHLPSVLDAIAVRVPRATRPNE